MHSLSQVLFLIIVIPILVAVEHEHIYDVIIVGAEMTGVSMGVELSKSNTTKNCANCLFKLATLFIGSLQHPQLCDVCRHGL